MIRSILPALLALSLLAPARASACGGFFCQSQPMDQAGENILFSVEDDGTLTTHVQILYSGEADAFAWILPLPSVPTSIGVGTDAIFQALAQQTRPQFQFTAQRTEGTCRATPSCPYDDYFDTDRAASAENSRGEPPSAGEPDAGSSVTVYLRETVGPYDAVVLGSGTTDELFAWLDENGYDIPSISRPIVGEYVAARHVFVAVRLVTGADTREIQPLVLRYREAQPCVPMRLTAIATVPDMPITAYFAASAYATPNNYVRLEPTFDDPRLWSGDLPYGDYVSALADDAGGRAFVTDYAGAMPAISVRVPSVEPLRTLTDPGEILRQLSALGLRNDSQILGILVRFLPPPEAYASDPRGYYNCLFSSWMSPASCGYAGGLDVDGLVTALTEQVVEPRAEAQDVIDRHPRMTRLFTTMSADEMTIDPTFSIDDGLPDVTNVHGATLITECGPTYFAWSAPQRIELPSGRTAPWREGVSYPGSDAAYCEDMRAGMFAPWVDPSTLRATARRRAIQVGGGGPVCSIGHGAPGAAGLALAGLALALVITRRRLG